mmetsp:Transcript_54906/g.108975  ORF Transcript_54906/g.108975 Transcript_54906/m.108975 type:complete len:261 (+) Transcript_54906:90-872(+)
MKFWVNAVPILIWVVPVARGLLLSPIKSQRHSTLSTKLKSQENSEVDNRRSFLGSIAGMAAILPFANSAEAYKELPQGRSVPLDQRERGRGPPGVNKPELLPAGPAQTIIDLEKMMVGPQKVRIDGKLAKLEKDTGFRVRVLTQAYPETPGLAIKDYWKVDGRTIVMVVDRGAYRGVSEVQTANILNFNVGSEVELALPPVFFTRVRNFFGGKQFVTNQGAGNAIEGAVDSMCECLRTEGGCNDVPDNLKDMATTSTNLF